MKILFIIPCFTFGGAERQAEILAKHLHRQGHDVEVWGFPSLGPNAPLLAELQNTGIDCTEFKEWPCFDWSFSENKVSLSYFFEKYIKWPSKIKKLGSRFPQKNYDYIIPFTPVPCLVASLLSKRIKSKVIIWNHRGGYNAGGIKYTRFIVDEINKSKPVFIANSEEGARFLSDTFFLPIGGVKVLRNIFSKERDAANGAKICDIGSRDGYSLKLIHVANMFAEKDIFTVLNALAILKSAQFRCHLKVVGFFPERADLELYQEKVKSSGLDEMVTYCGSVDKMTLNVLLCQSDIGLLSSRSEGAPNCILEYMDARLPVIATDIPGVRALLPEANRDWLFPIGDAESLAKIIISLGSNPVLCRQLGLLNEARVKKDFSAEALLPEWLNTLAERY